MTEILDSGLDALVSMHRCVEMAAQELATLNQDRLQCRKGCCSCCEDGLTVFSIEADLLRAMYPKLLQQEEAAPPGQCAFLDGSGGCRVYEHRPYVCRTQGLPLRWVEEEGEDEWVEYRDICPLNEAGEPIEQLETNECWLIGPFEGQLAQIQHTRSGDFERVALRNLFQNQVRSPQDQSLAKKMDV